jgi:hypothetical protein
MREVGMVVLDRQDRQDRQDSDAGSAADGGFRHVELRDVELQAEIELVADLVLAASGSEAPLTAADIDRVLGVVPAAPSAAPSTAPSAS